MEMLRCSRLGFDGLRHPAPEGRRLRPRRGRHRQIATPRSAGGWRRRACRSGACASARRTSGTSSSSAAPRPRRAAELSAAPGGGVRPRHPGLPLRAAGDAAAAPPGGAAVCLPPPRPPAGAGAPASATCRCGDTGIAWRQIGRCAALVVDLAALDGAHGPERGKAARHILEEGLCHAVASDLHQPAPMPAPSPAASRGSRSGSARSAWDAPVGGPAGDPAG